MFPSCIFTFVQTAHAENYHDHARSVNFNFIIQFLRLVMSSADKATVWIWEDIAPGGARTIAKRVHNLCFGLVCIPFVVNTHTHTPQNTRGVARWPAAAHRRTRRPLTPHKQACTAAQMSSSTYKNVFPCHARGWAG